MAYENLVKGILQNPATWTFTKAPAPHRMPPSGGGRLLIVDSDVSVNIAEYIDYTGVTDNGATFTLTGVTRAKEGTVSVSWPVSSVLLQPMTAGKITSIEQTATDALPASSYTAADVMSKISSQTIIQWESGKHAITANDGSGNVNIKFALSPDGNFTCTEDGHGLHEKFAQSTGTLSLSISNATGVTGQAYPGWNQIYSITPTTFDITAINFLRNGNEVWHEGNLNPSQFMRSDANDVKTAGHTTYNDSRYLRFGTGEKMEFFFWNSNMYIDFNTGANYLLMRDGVTNRFTFRKDTGDFTATGNVSGYSDIRVKTDLKPIEGALFKVCQLTGYTFERTDCDMPRQAGLVAQELQAVLPEVVSEDETGRLAVAYGNTIALLVQAIKEQQAQIEELKERL